MTFISPPFFWVGSRSLRAEISKYETHIIIRARHQVKFFFSFFLISWFCWTSPLMFFLERLVSFKLHEGLWTFLIKDTYHLLQVSFVAHGLHLVSHTTVVFIFSLALEVQEFSCILLFNFKMELDWPAKCNVNSGSNPRTNTEVRPPPPPMTVLTAGIQYTLFHSAWLFWQWLFPTVVSQLLACHLAVQLQTVSLLRRYNLCLKWSLLRQGIANFPPL